MRIILAGKRARVIRSPARAIPDAPVGPADIIEAAGQPVARAHPAAHPRPSRRPTGAARLPSPASHQRGLCATVAVPSEQTKAGRGFGMTTTRPVEPGAAATGKPSQMVYLFGSGT